MLNLIQIIAIILVAQILGCLGQNTQEQLKVGESVFVHERELTANENLQNVLLNYGIDLFHSEVIAYKGQIIISSRGGKIMSLTMDGEVNWSLERPGRGPGEFEDPHDMQITDDMIGILNKEDAKIILYTIKGQFYKDVKLRGSADQFGMVDGGVHIFYPYHNDFLFARYDIETGEEQRYGDRDLIEVLPERRTSDNFMFYRNILQTDDRYTVVGLVHYALILIYDREEDSGTLMDLSEEMEIAASLKSHREWVKKSPRGAGVTSHFLDLVKTGDFFGVIIPGPWEKDYASMYRISPHGRIYDKVYKAMEGEFKVGAMKNLTMLDDGIYFGHISSMDRLVIVSIAEEEMSSN